MGCSNSASSTGTSGYGIGTSSTVGQVGQGVWQVEDDHAGWTTLIAEDNLLLEAAYNKQTKGFKSPIRTHLGPGRYEYEIDFRAMKQRNMRTGKCRALRRIMDGSQAPGTSSDASSPAVAPLQPITFSELPAFEEVFAALRPFHSKLGGTPFFGRKDPEIRGKLKQRQLANSSNYEYVYMTILGFQALEKHAEEIVRLNNGAFYKQNPGVQLLEEVCGFTMHGERDGANGIVVNAPSALLQAFAVARMKGILDVFFKTAFDRTSQPCLEGRYGEVLKFLETHSTSKSSGEPPWQDLHVEIPSKASMDKVIGEHLRVFNNECIWKWANSQGMAYDRAKHLWERANGGLAVTRTSSGSLLPDVARMCNERTFLDYLAAKGMIKEGTATAEAVEGPPFPREDVETTVLLFVEMETLHPSSTE